MDAFTMQIDAFVKKAKGRMEEFCSEFVQDIAEEVVRATPYKTGFLRASWSASIGSPPAHGEGVKPDVSGVATVARLNLAAVDFGPGDVIYYTNGAVYAKRVHWGFSGADSLGREYNQLPKPWVSDVMLRSNLIAQKTAKRVGAES